MSEELANYESSFFVMNVPTEADLEIRYMSDEDFAVFFHEYIHFLQDITSFYGYSGIYSHGEYIRKVLNEIYSGPKQFKVPVPLEDENDNVWLNKAIAELSLGYWEDLDCVIIKDAYIEQFPLNDTFSLPTLHVIAITSEGTKDIEVGAYAIRENMAYLLERKCTTKFKTSSEFPYQIVEILANYMCPGKLSDLDIIALCDVALQCSVPGHGVYRMLEAIASEYVIVNRPEDIYDFYFSKHNEFMGERMSSADTLRKAAIAAIDHLESYVRVEQLSEEYKDWIDFTFVAGVETRIRHPYFFLNMARGKKNKNNEVLQFLAKYIGSPQMVNSLGKRFQLATERPICRFEYIEAVRELESLFELGKRSCNLKPWCEMSPDGAPVDERCEKTPWERCNDKQLCPYGLLWRHWNLADKEVVFN